MSINPTQNQAIILYSPPISSEEFVKQELEKAQAEKSLSCKHGLEFPVNSALPYREVGKPELTQKIHNRFSQLILNFYDYCKRESISIDVESMICQRIYTMDLSEKEICWTSTKSENTTFYKIEKFVLSILKTRSFPSSQFETWEFTLIVDGGSRKERFHLSSSKLIDPKHLPSPYCNGNEFEISYPQEVNGYTTKKWDHWKEEYKVAYQFYQEKIYGLIVDVFARACASLNHRPLSVLDVGGGDAEVSIHLLNHCRHIEQIYMIEKSKEQVSVALLRKTLSCVFQRPKDSEKLKVSPPMDLTKIDLEQVTEKRKMDVILLSGIAAADVLKREESWELLKKCQRVLKEDGFVFVTSYSDPYFCSEDYKAMGFEVLNKTVPYKEKKEDLVAKHQSFYVLRKI